jgi:DNA-binding IclR family transcriptional regulator
VKLDRTAVAVPKVTHLHTSALGKAILAALDEREVKRIVEQTGLPRRTPSIIASRDRFERELQKISIGGIAESNEENYVGALGIAASIQDGSGAVVAAITIAARRPG